MNFCCCTTRWASLPIPGVPRELGYLLSLFDGTRTHDEIIADYKKLGGEELPAWFIEKTVADLDENYMIESPRFESPVARSGAKSGAARCIGRSVVSLPMCNSCVHSSTASRNKRGSCCLRVLSNRASCAESWCRTSTLRAAAWSRRWPMNRSE
jgi:hypothetical protein